MFRLFVSRTTARRPRNVTPQIESLERVLSLSVGSATSFIKVILTPASGFPAVQVYHETPVPVTAGGASAIVLGPTPAPNQLGHPD
jgi:hypothetical protein